MTDHVGHEFSSILDAVRGLNVLSPEDRRRQQARGLIGLGAALLQAGAPSKNPVGIAGGLGAGLLGFQQGIEASRNDIIRQKMQQLQLAGQLANVSAGLSNARTKAEERRAKIQNIKRFQERAKSFLGNIPDGTFDPVTLGQLESAVESGDIGAFNTGVNAFRREAGADKRAMLNRAMSMTRLRSEENRATLNRETQREIAQLRETGADRRLERREEAANKRLGVSLAARAAELQQKLAATRQQAEEKAKLKSFDNANVLRDDLFRSKKAIGFDEATAGFEKVKEAAKLNTGVGDVSLIFGYMKILDPESTVREGEFATAEQTGGISSRIVNLYNKVVNGERLTKKQRDDFIKGAESLYRPIRNANSRIEDQFRKIAERNKINFEDVLAGQAASPETKQNLPPLPPGFRVVQ